MLGLPRSANPTNRLASGPRANQQALRLNAPRGCLAETERLAKTNGCGESRPPIRLHKQTTKKLPQLHCAIPDARPNRRGHSQKQRLWGGGEAR